MSINDQTTSTTLFDDFKITESSKLIFNKNIVESNVTINDIAATEHVALPVARDMVVTHQVIRNFITKNNISINLSFPKDSNIIVINENNRFIIFLGLRDMYTKPLDDKFVFLVYTELRDFCVNNQCTQIHTLAVDGLSTLTSHTRIRSMLRFIFKPTDIVVHIHSDYSFSTEDKHNLISEYHNSLTGGHSGTSHTIKRLQLLYSWKNMKKDVKEFIKACETCQKNKRNKKFKQKMMITTSSTKPFQRVSMDLVGVLKKKPMGNTHILTFQDDLSRYVVTVALADIDAATVAQAFVECLICVYGVPSSILTDQGSNFMADIFKRTCKLLGITKLNTTSYHPQCNGHIERYHSSLKTFLKSFIDKGGKQLGHIAVLLNVLV